MFHTLYDHKSTKEEEIKERFRLGGPNELYFGKGNRVIDQYNRRRNILARIKDNDEKFRKTKHKIKLVVYKNGFILNNCPFRDRALPENNDFMESVEKGNIPQEFIRRGIKDLGILLINRKTEIYNSRLYKSLPTSFDYLDISQNKNQNQTYKRDFRKMHPLDAFFQSQKEIKNVKDNLSYSTRNERIPNRLCRASSQETRRAFVPFSGRGILLANAKIDGTLIKDEIKVDHSRPICDVNIMLSSGEFLECKFNYDHTVKDIYNYVRGKSKIKDFILFDTFSSVIYLDFERTVEELKLGETILAQRKK
jgi:UBX domain-containing protein 1